MPVKQLIPYSSGTFFINFTCFQWIPLIEVVKGYDIVYKWFDHLKTALHFINGYVIMPNHVHTMISFSETAQRINTIVCNGKRFMAYEIVKRLHKNGEFEMLAKLRLQVEPKRKANSKKHDVWELSFDWKECNSPAFTDQKLEYIHNNPCSGKWNLCNVPEEYVHSYAKCYATGEQGVYPVTNIMQMEGVEFERKKISSG